MLKNILSLDGVTVLNKNQQKAVNGGLANGSGTCAAFVPCSLPGEHDDSCGGGSYVYNVSKSEAQAHVANGGYWCCDSCSSASWY
jgi:hypothetical protein